MASVDLVMVETVLEAVDLPFFVTSLLLEPWRDIPYLLSVVGEAGPLPNPETEVAVALKQ